MTNKTTQDAIQDFLNAGGEITKHEFGERSEHTDTLEAIWSGWKKTPKFTEEEKKDPLVQKQLAPFKFGGPRPGHSGY